MRQLGSSYGPISRSIYYEGVSRAHLSLLELQTDERSLSRLSDCLANKSGAERTFRSELSNAGIDILHRPWSGVDDVKPNEALQADLKDFVEQKRPGPRTIIVASVHGMGSSCRQSLEADYIPLTLLLFRTMDGGLAPTLKDLATDSGVSLVVIAPETVRHAYPKPIAFAPLSNLLHLSSWPSFAGRAEAGRRLDVQDFFKARYPEPGLPPSEAKFDLGEFFSGDSKPEGDTKPTKPKGDTKPTKPKGNAKPKVGKKESPSTNAVLRRTTGVKPSLTIAKAPLPVAQAGSCAPTITDKKKASDSATAS